MSPSDFDRLGELLRNHVDTHESEQAHALLRARVIAHATPKPRRAPLLIAAAFALAAASAVTTGLLVHRPSEPLSFHVGNTGSSQPPGTWIAPAGDQPLSLRFSEGSVIVLEPRARARIARTTPLGAALQLETGRARFDIVHRGTAEWIIDAGPYHVEVRGTVFTAAWDPVAEVFELTLETGAVVISGPGIESGVRLDGSQHFVGRPSERASAPAETQRAAPEPAASTVMPSASSLPGEPTGARRPDAAPRSSDSPPPSAQPAETWTSLAAKGQYRRVVELAEPGGLGAACSSASEPELWALAEASRLTGKAATARQALLAIRTRFPASAHASAAAFLLGRMSDDSGSLVDAIAWYDRYIAEAPGGAFAPEAMGRRMVALRKAGNSAEAVRSASAYLRRFPNGPYAGVARDLVGP